MVQSLPRGRVLVRLLAGAALALAGRAAAQATSDYAVQVTAAVQNAPPRITLAWPSFAGATPARRLSEGLGDRLVGDRGRDARGDRHGICGLRRDGRDARTSTRCAAPRRSRGTDTSRRASSCRSWRTAGRWSSSSTPRWRRPSPPSLRASSRTSRATAGRSCATTSPRTATPPSVKALVKADYDADPVAREERLPVRPRAGPVLRKHRAGRPHGPHRRVARGPLLRRDGRDVDGHADADGYGPGKQRPGGRQVRPELRARAGPSSSRWGASTSRTCPPSPRRRRPTSCAST